MRIRTLFFAVLMGLCACGSDTSSNCIEPDSTASTEEAKGYCVLVCSGVNMCLDEQVTLYECRREFVNNCPASNGGPTFVEAGGEIPEECTP